MTNSNATVGGDYVNQGQVAMTVRSVGLFGGGEDPVHKVLGYENQEREAVETELLSRSSTDAGTNPGHAGPAENAAPLSDEELRLADHRTLRIGVARQKVDPPLSDEEASTSRPSITRPPSAPPPSSAPKSSAASATSAAW